MTSNTALMVGINDGLAPIRARHGWARLRRALTACTIPAFCLILPTPAGAQTPAFGAQQVATGAYHTCAITELGGVKCFGLNANGQLGDGSSTNRLTPVDVAGLTSGVAAISAGSIHTCALTTGGAVKCFGYNAFGQLGDGSSTTRPAPVDVAGFTSGVAAIAAGPTTPAR